MRKVGGFRTAGLGMAVVLLAGVPAAAMVPPRIQQRNMLRAIIDLPALDPLFPISRIERVAPNIWRLTSGPCHIDVTMLARRGPGHGLVGPRYEPRAGRRVCQRPGAERRRR
jgi:hypothetical protein